MINCVIIGSGNVAQAIATALFDAKKPPLQIFARNEKEGTKIAQEVGCGFASKPEELVEAELYIIAVSDKAIAPVAKSLNFGDSIVAHTAGSVDVNKLGSKIRNKAVFYPLQTFTKGRKVDFKEVPLMIEGTTIKALETVREVASRISDNVLEVKSADRAMIHLAAVFVSNFTNHMYRIGEMLAEDAKMDFSILKPLIMETANKAMAAKSPKDTQTGPAIRNDFLTKSLHSEMLVEKQDLKSIYINLSKSIWETSKKI